MIFFNVGWELVVLRFDGCASRVVGCEWSTAGVEERGMEGGFNKELSEEERGGVRGKEMV